MLSAFFAYKIKNFKEAATPRSLLGAYISEPKDYTMKNVLRDMAIVHDFNDKLANKKILDKKGIYGLVLRNSVIGSISTTYSHSVNGQQQKRRHVIMSQETTNKEGPSTIEDGSHVVPPTPMRLSEIEISSSSVNLFRKIQTIPRPSHRQKSVAHRKTEHKSKSSYKRRSTVLERSAKSTPTCRE